MLRILIDPLATPVVVAFAVNNDVMQVAHGVSDDRAQALEEAFRALGFEGTPNEIVVVAGPGNFTGIRAGIGFARGLALAYGCASRGISILEIDQAISGGTQVWRDARGGRAYQANFEDDSMQGVSLVSMDAVIGDSIDDGSISCTGDELIVQLLNLAVAKKGAVPASAFYIRSPNAAKSSDPKLVILDD